MNKLVMVALVAVVVGGIYFGAYGSAYLVLATTPQGAGASGTVTTAESSTSQQTSSAIATTSSAPRSTVVITSTTPTSTATQTTTTSQTSSASTTSHASSSAQGSTFVAVIEATGWNGSKTLVIQAKLGQVITINVAYNDPFGEDHPLFVTGPASFQGPDMNSGHQSGQIQFTPTIAGTYSVVCLNPDCSIHNAISGTLEIVVK